jgi:hypothetical protein
MKQIGIYDAKWFSPQGLIPPAVTGVHNGDAIKAWMDQSIIYVVGEDSRPVLLNTQNEFWPLIATVAGNGYDVLTIMGRWVGPIYYSCDTPDCTLQEWMDISHGSGTLAISSLTSNRRKCATSSLCDRTLRCSIRPT